MLQKKSVLFQQIVRLTRCYFIFVAILAGTPALMIWTLKLTAKAPLENAPGWFGWNLPRLMAILPIFRGQICQGLGRVYIYIYIGLPKALSSQCGKMILIILQRDLSFSHACFPLLKCLGRIQIIRWSSTKWNPIILAKWFLLAW